MEQPLGFVTQKESSGLVCRLCKSLYRHKQSPRTWFGKSIGVIQQFSMTQWDRSFYFLSSL